jgi:hypothetical protein
LVAGGGNGYRPLVVVYHLATAIVAVVRIHVQHFFARVVADIHGSAAPGWKKRPAELYPDRIADVNGHWQQEEATYDPGRRSSNLPIEIHGDYDH